jgi:hypothetical protein
VRKIFITEHNGVMEDLNRHFEVVPTIEEAEVIILWQDVVGWCKSFARLAKSMKKKIVILQHGIGSMDDYGPPNSYEMLADKVCVWSQNDVDMLKQFGISPNRYVLTGTPIWQHLKPKAKHNGVNVLFKPAHWDVDLEENYEVMDELRKIKGINLYTKIHESHDSLKFENPIKSNREQAGHLDTCADALAKADVVVGIGSEGTFGLMAYVKDIPVIVPDVWKARNFLNAPTPEMKYTEACHFIKLPELKGAIWNAIEHPEFKREERKRVAEYYGGVSIENPLDRIIDVVNSI